MFQRQPPRGCRELHLQLTAAGRTLKQRAIHVPQALICLPGLSTSEIPALSQALNSLLAAVMAVPNARFNRHHLPDHRQAQHRTHATTLSTELKCRPAAYEKLKMLTLAFRARRFDTPAHAI